MHSLRLGSGTVVKGHFALWLGRSRWEAYWAGSEAFHLPRRAGDTENPMPPTVAALEELPAG